MKSRLLEKYNNEIISQMTERFRYKNRLQTPRISKIVINMGIGAGAADVRIIEEAVEELALIAGQRPVITRAKKSIANFKIRENLPVGCKVTLRGDGMYEFLDRLVNVALPRIRDFRGVSPISFDNEGNYAFGIVEHTIFPELNIDRIQRTQGMDIIITIPHSTKEESLELLKLFGMPFKK